MTEIDIERLGRQVAAHIIDAFNAAEFGDRLAERVADLVVERTADDYRAEGGGR